MRCIRCDSTAAIERVSVLASTDGPVLLTRWRCRADVHHWWDGATDAAPMADPPSARLSALDRDLVSLARHSVSGGLSRLPDDA
jgi:hypothetical protein